jgi:hypothetical protein
VAINACMRFFTAALLSSAGRPKSAGEQGKPADAPPPPLAALCAAWSPVFTLATTEPGKAAASAAASGSDTGRDGSGKQEAGCSSNSGGGSGRAVLLAVGTQGGLVWLWSLPLPAAYTLQRTAPRPAAQLVRAVA